MSTNTTTPPTTISSATAAGDPLAHFASVVSELQSATRALTARVDALDTRDESTDVFAAQSRVFEAQARAFDSQARALQCMAATFDRIAAALGHVAPPVPAEPAAELPPTPMLSTASSSASDLVAALRQPAAVVAAAAAPHPPLPPPPHPVALQRPTLSASSSIPIASLLDAESHSAVAADAALAPVRKRSRTPMVLAHPPPPSSAAAASGDESAASSTPVIQQGEQVKQRERSGEIERLIRVHRNQWLLSSANAILAEHRAAYDRAAAASSSSTAPPPEAYAAPSTDNLASTLVTRKRECIEAAVRGVLAERGRDAFEVDGVVWDEDAVLRKATRTINGFFTDGRRFGVNRVLDGLLAGDEQFLSGNAIKRDRTTSGASGGAGGYSGDEQGSAATGPKAAKRARKA
ncbi:hypothetical protein H9P43_004102 [Blastocladiella emersonii ATCC 22665]|nr:hypothetical protein H9P43_004102 [Blastocladiella emersonii ATCC 22665]